MAAEASGNSTSAPCLLVREWKAKLWCTGGVLFYYLLGYFILNRFPFSTYHSVTHVPLFDDLPVIPWTIVVYNSVFILCGLGIWLLPDRRSVRRYFLSVVFAYSINYLAFAVYPTYIDRAPVPQDGSLWLWAVELTRQLDEPHTCFPSLHITNCTLAVIGVWRTGHGWWMLLWTLAIALTTLTTDQHLFLDLPAGAAVAGVGALLARRVVPVLPTGPSSPEGEPAGRE